MGGPHESVRVRRAGKSRPAGRFREASEKRELRPALAGGQGADARGGAARAGGPVPLAPSHGPITPCDSRAPCPLARKEPACRVLGRQRGRHHHGPIAVLF